MANTLGDVVGTTGDAHCDRRFVDPGGEPAAFCQEIVDTVVVSQFSAACRDRYKAAGGEGRCAREHVIGGCKLSLDNDDGSQVWDWYYDVSDLERQMGGPLPDGGKMFETTARTQDDVRRLCADRRRYEEGATYQDP